MRIFKKTTQVILMFVGVMILVLSLIGVDEAAAKEKAKSTEEKARMVAIDRKRKMINAAKEKLGNTVWQIKCTQIGNNKGKERYKDTLRFIDNKVKSDRLVSEGFPATNYTVRIKEIKGQEGRYSIIWETIQASEKAGKAFWHGELEEEDVMRGVLSWHLDEKREKGYTFVSVEKEIITEKAEEKPVVEEKKEETLSTQELMGEIVSINSKKSAVVIKYLLDEETQTHKTTVFYLTNETGIEKDGEMAGVSDLKEEDIVTLQFVTNGEGKKITNFIVVEP